MNYALFFHHCSRRKSGWSLSAAVGPGPSTLLFVDTFEVYLGELLVESLDGGEEAAANPEGLLLEALVLVGDGVSRRDVGSVLQQHVQNLMGGKNLHE